MAEFGELVTLLASLAPEKLAKLRTKFPDFEAELRPGAVLGDSSSDLACDVALNALGEFTALALQILPSIRSRLAWSWRFDLVAKIAAACGSGGTVGALTTGLAEHNAVIPAIVALIGSMCALFFTYLQKDEAAGSVSDSYNRLIVGLVEADQLQRALPRLCAQGPSAELNEALTKANETAKTLNEMWIRYR